MTVKKEDIVELLRENKTVVTFTKVDGTERTMVCTLNPDLIPSNELATTESGKKSNPAVTVVWDLEKEGWRSFRIDSVVSYE